MTTDTIRPGRRAGPPLRPAAVPSDPGGSWLLTADGRPTRRWREDLRRIPQARNIVTVAGAWGQSLGVAWAAIHLSTWWAYAIAFVLVGRGHMLLNVLGHEAAHRLLFRDRRMNDFVGRWLLSSLSLTPFESYRRAHLAHHRDPLGEDEPDLALYLGYPVPPSTLRRRLRRDALFVSGAKILRSLIRAWGRPEARPILVRIAVVQTVIAAGFATAGAWCAYPLLWVAPWASVWRVLNRLRALAEHAGLEASADQRQVTHVVRQTVLARLWLVPYNTGYHLAHHIDMGIPFRNLPKLHRELERAGWVSDALEWESYRALWRALGSATSPEQNDRVEEHR